MNCSSAECTTPPIAEESYKQICGRNALDVGWFGSSGWAERNDMVMVDPNGKGERNVAYPKESDAELNESDVQRKDSNVAHTGRDVVHMEYFRSQWWCHL